MKTKYSKIVMLLAGIWVLQACSIDAVQDPNFPSVGSVSANASKAQLAGLAVGQISLARNSLATYTQVTGTIGKELFNFNTTESRWMTELNGLRIIDNSAFYNGATTGFGLPIRQANIILASVDKTNSVTTEERNALKGLANTFKGLAYLYMLNAQYQNGVRLNVEDPFKPSKPATYAESLAGIAGFLDQGATQLDAGGTSFPFSMPSGYAGFDTPASFKKFNRAIALRVAIYQADWAKAASILPTTFFNETGSLATGPKHTFNPSAPDFANPMVNVSSANVVAVEKLFDDIEAGDARKSKVTTVTPLTYTSGTTYSSKYLANVYTSATTPFTIIKNEELVLIAAEIAANQNDLVNAKKYVDIIRVANNLTPVAAFASKDIAIDAILKERLYSLWYEGHRWVDMRRYNKIAQIYLPVAGMKVLTQLERPVAEVNWDTANP